MSDGPYQPSERPSIVALRPAAGVRPRDDATYFPMPWLLSTARLRRARRQRRDQLLRLGERRRERPVSVEVAGARRSRLRFFAGPRAAPTSCARFTRADRPPAARPRRRGSSARGSSRRAATRRRPRDAAQGGRRARFGRPDLHPLPAVRRPVGRHGGRARAARRSSTTPGSPSRPTSTRWSARLRPALRRGARPRRADPRRSSASPTSTATPARRSSSSRSSTSPRRARRVLRARCSRRRSATATTGGWRTSASTRRPTRGRPTARRARDAQPLPDRSTTAAAYDFAAARLARSRASIARAGPARPACAQIVWGGDPTTDWGFDGLRLGGTPGPDHGPVRASACGARTSAASSPCRRRS